MISSSETIQAACLGDLQAFNRLVIEYQDLAYTFAYSLLGNERYAIEATQAAFLRAYREMGSFRQGSFRGWLLRRVLVACEDRVHKIDRKRRPAPHLPNGTAASLEELHCKLRKLPAEYCVVAVLVDLLGMGYEEAAQAAGCTPRALSYRLARARAELGDNSTLQDA